MAGGDEERAESSGKVIAMTQQQESDRRKAIQRAAWELRIAIVHGEGVDTALDHLHQAQRAERLARRSTGLRAS